MIGQVCNDLLFDRIDLRADRSNIRFRQHFERSAVRPENIAKPIAMTIWRFIPTIFNKSIGLADLIDPKYLAVIRARRELILDQTLDTVLQRELLAAVHALGEPDHEILLRRYYYQQKPKDIAYALNLTVKQVENRLFRAKLLLRKRLEGESI